MANLFANGAVAIVAFAACVTPAFACATEFLMTDAEIAAYKNGQLSGEVAPRYSTQMTAPDLSEPTKADTMDDVIARAGSSLLAQEDMSEVPETPALAPPATASAPIAAPQAAPARQLAQAEPERKRMLVTCSGGIYPAATL